MRRFAIAAVLVAVFGSTAGAQPIPTVQPKPEPTPVLEMVPPVPPPPPAVYQPNVFVPPGTRPGPAVPFHKSGGVVVGAYGFYPYDTGDWLLGGTEGLTRQSGSFTMVGPSVFPATRRKHALFNR
jgi:hypothetical protein